MQIWHFRLKVRTAASQAANGIAKLSSVTTNKKFFIKKFEVTNKKFFIKKFEVLDDV